VRFNGLLFNQDGSMRMDCGQVNEGAPPGRQINRRAHHCGYYRSFTS
jgi:hypothetical protein